MGRRSIEKRRRIQRSIAILRKQAEEKRAKLEKALKHERWEEVEKKSLIEHLKELIGRRKLQIRHLEKDLLKLSGKVEHEKKKYANIVKMLHEARMLKARKHAKFLK